MGSERFTINFYRCNSRINCNVDNNVYTTITIIDAPRKQLIMSNIIKNKLIFVFDN